MPKKAFALINFFILMGAFLLYRGGFLDQFISVSRYNNLPSPNGGVSGETKKDTTKLKSDSLATLRLSSSKSMVLTDGLKSRSDTIRQKRDSVSNTNQLSPEQLRILYSSKSGVIVEPKRNKSDTAKIRTKKKEKK